MAEALSLLELLQGIGSLVFVAISIGIGFIIISKYFKLKNKIFLYVGIAWQGISFGWLPDAINLILYLTGFSFLPDAIYLTIAVGFLPIFVLLWLAGMSDLLKYKKKKIILIVYLIITVVYEIIFWVLLIIDVNNIGTRIGPFHYQFSEFTDIFMILLIIIVLITGLKFAWESAKSEHLEVKLKGKFLIFAFILFIFGAILEILIPLNEFIVVLVRIILISSSFTFYIGFLLPNWAKKIFLKEK